MTPPIHDTLIEQRLPFAVQLDGRLWVWLATGWVN